LSEFVTSERLFAGDSLILTELSHRISNEFASAISTVSLAAARSDNGEVKAALSMALATSAWRESLAPIQAVPGQRERYDCEYRRNGTVNLFIFLDPGE
jgi:hypothetical protein